MIDYKQILDLLKDRDDYLILIHRNPDGDAIGSAEALRLLLLALGKKAEILSYDPAPAYLRFLPKKPFFSAENGTLPADRTYISVDVAEEKLFGFDPDAIPGGIYLKIDHHKTGRDFAAFNFVDPTASAAGEMVYLLGLEAGVESLPFFTAIYGAIASDTGCFRYSNATARTFSIASRLICCGVDTKMMNAALFENKDRLMVKANAIGILSATFHFGGRAAVLVFTNEMCAQNGLQSEHLAELSSVLREIEGVELSVVLKEKKDAPGSYRISARSKHYFDCTALCAAFSGGGHARAAGGDICASSAQQAEAQILLEIGRQLSNP
ncbi:MAG: DHH family phosphoesterase [Clostridia bacterium]|nr:DHH family phosphoesterase [Clostridia bacterium]